MPVLKWARTVMKLKHRIGIFTAGLLFLVYGLLKARQYGVFPYLNYWKQPVFPVGVEIAAVILMAMAFLPTGTGLNRMFSTRPARTAHVLQKFRPRQY